MNIWLGSVIAVILSYLAGSIPTAYIVSRLATGTDIRKVGSGNMGAMNVFYKVGFWAGLTVGIVDAGKGSLAVYFGTLFAHLANAGPLPTTILQMVCGLGAIAGHNFPAYLGFKRGGKGGACAVGIVFFLVPLGIPAYILLFLILLAITRYGTISYAASFIAFPLTAWAEWSTPVDEWLRTTLPALAWMQSGAVVPAQHILLIIYPILVILIPLLAYIPRIKEIMGKAGSFKKAAFRRSLKDRL